MTARSRWPRIDVYVPNPRIRSRIRVAAARQEMRISQWCLQAILERLGQEERGQVDSSVSALFGQDLLPELITLQKKIKAHRRGKIITSLDDHLETARLERNHELFGLR